MQTFLFIAAGGAIGAILRYLVSGFVIKITGAEYFWGTVAVNLIGCFLIGLAWGVFSNLEINPNIKMFVFTGFLGAFTTFSTFAIDNFHLYRNGELPLLAVNVAVSNITGIFLVFAGYYVSKILAYKC